MKLIALLTVATIVAGCSAEGDPPVRSCTESSDCPAGQTCVDGVCTAPDDGGTADGSACTAARQCGAVCCAATEVCGAGSCCAPSELCGGACCTADQTCEADTCVLSCDAGETACVDTCCGSGDLCYLGECVTPGAPCTSTFECPDGEYCEATAGRCLPRATGGMECEYRPTIEMFELTEEWSWSGDPAVVPTHDQVMMAPMVANLNDDNGDGSIDENDIPDVVFHTFPPTSPTTNTTYWYHGVLRAVSGADGSRLWPTTDPTYRTTPGGEIAIGDVDPTSPGPEIAACSRSVGSLPATSRQYGHLLLIAADGTLLRRFDTAPNLVPCGFDAPAIGDMNNDGTPEIVVRYVIAHADGTVVQRIRDDTGDPTRVSGVYTALYDVDDDGTLELVGGNGVYRYDGTPVWEDLAQADGRIAIADLDLDDDPDIVVIGGGHFIRANEASTGAVLWGPTDVNPPELAATVAADGNPNGGGPPTIANFDADENPEIAFAGGFAYVVFEHDGTRSWYHVTQDRSSRSTGSSIFDFEGDGVAEVLYNDEQYLRVFRGPDGAIFHQQCNVSGTLREYPIVVDVDNDDHAEIVLMENNYSSITCEGSGGGTGIHVFGHPTNQWVRTRRIWNQHTYHVTNIDEDGTVPTNEAPNFRNPRLNNFRQNVQPDGLFDAPDLILVDMSANTFDCPTSLTIFVRVLNQGRAGAPAGIPVTLYETSMGRALIGRASTTRPLLPGESELLELTFPIPAGRESDTFSFEAVLNDPADMPIEGVNECREDNNTSDPFTVVCPTIM